MPVIINEMTSEVATADEEFPLSPQQVERLVAMVVARIDDKQREQEAIREATTIRREAMPLSDHRD